ncbi:hypothetical protein NM208_g2937 [Fusarium decemcellulare]|uniref:Uncharacterized protein n=1 Tax=Fusarium decemcellulare TaxID=57161 RepID=A0ACC1SR53_9HYPO|nr:hypothetical protein NM208_g2937 [Fusarium decemcellulare]
MKATWLSANVKSKRKAEIISLSSKNSCTSANRVIHVWIRLAPKRRFGPVHILEFSEDAFETVPGNPYSYTTRVNSCTWRVVLNQDTKPTKSSDSAQQTRFISGLSVLAPALTPSPLLRSPLSEEVGNGLGWGFCPVRFQFGEFQPTILNNSRGFISSVEVLYSEDDDKPADTIDEINGRKADINKGHGGSVHRAQAPDQMVNYLWIDIDGDGGSSDGRQDLAEGAGDEYRYVGVSQDGNARRFIADVGLWRSDNRQVHPPPDWDGMTHDINQGRGGDYLYLVWRTHEFVINHPDVTG